MQQKPSRLSLPVHSADSAPSAARDALREVKHDFGFVPNLLGMLSNAPVVLDAYRALSGCFERSSLSATERQVVLLAVSMENRCAYCVAAHSVIAGMQLVDPEHVRRLRGNEALGDAKLEELRSFAVELLRSRGWPSSTRIERFLTAGYGPAQVLEVVLGVALKTLSNYANHLAATPLDAAFVSAAIALESGDASQASRTS